MIQLHDVELTMNLEDLKNIISKCYEIAFSQGLSSSNTESLKSLSILYTECAINEIVTKVEVKI